MNATRQKQEVVNELRSTYQVEVERTEQDERELTYHLAGSRVRPLHETEIGRNTLEGSNRAEEAVQSVAESVSAGLRQEAEPRVEPMHDEDIHERMAEAAVEGTDYESEVDTVKEAAVEPDTWTQKCRVCSKDWMSLGDNFDIINISPDVVEQEIRQAIRAIDESAIPHHMYVPGGETIGVMNLLSVIDPRIDVLEVEVTGAAPDEAQEHWFRVEDGGSEDDDLTEVGRALHFMQDLSHPLHTGAIGPQVLATQGTIHDAYRYFVEDNWENAEDTQNPLIYQFNQGTENEQLAASMKTACEAVAESVAPYSEQVYETILNNGLNNRDDWAYTVEGSAIAGMWNLGAYSHGRVSLISFD
ncbi:hypothetical protein [Haloarchaeobius litoreus]|uniref:Uncharacterized protein n=1 Tax=Haloarchaeobius litoreus TaxID=755306 RepID=A0ABD6DRH6_9EURY|nr:hypothetical protein [Haloarchaeobius litoreus]